jgi:hypothetical protein
MRNILLTTLAILIITAGTAFGAVRVIQDDQVTDDLTVNGYMEDSDIDTETELESWLTDTTDVFTNNDGALDDDDVTSADVGLASDNLDDTDASVEWEDADNLDASGNLTTEVFSVCVASTSQAFVSGGTLPVPPMEEAYTISALNCYVSGGTSAVVTLSDGTNDMDSLTCATTLTSDDGSIANSSVTAGELMQLDFGTITGEVNYVCYSAYGTN